MSEIQEKVKEVINAALEQAAVEACAVLVCEDGNMISPSIVRKVKDAILGLRYDPS